MQAAACALRSAGALAACARRAVGADALVGARRLSAEAKAGEPDADAAAAAAAAEFVKAAGLKAHADKFKTLDEVLTKKRRELKEAGMSPKERKRLMRHAEQYRQGFFKP